MAEKSKIEWTESTWNPVTGCTKISEGCQHCYAERMARRLCAMGQENYMGRLNKEYLEIQIAINYLLKNFGNLKKEYLMTKNMLV